MYAVCVMFQLKPDCMGDFMPLMLENARASLDAEPDCHQFDVATDPERPDAVFLYELYSDRAAFEVHLASDHFRAFNATTREMIAKKAVTTWPEVTQ